MEPIRETVVVTLEEDTQIAVARRAAADLCRRLQLSQSAIARAELIAVELAGNILRHAQSGQLFLAPVPCDPRSLDIVAVDRGPGLGDLDRAMEDGFSTGTTPGVGLGTVRRQSDLLDVFSQANGGTVIAATLRDTPAAAIRDGSATCDVSCAVLSTHIVGETLNGDSWSIYPSDERQVFLVVDGLGHGPQAAQAAAVAVAVADRAFAAEPQVSLTTVIQRMNLAMQSTRGAAVLLVSIEGDQAHCCGVGNISAVLCARDGSCRSMVSHNGTVGHRMARVQEFSYPVVPDTLLIMHSDGISARWKLSQYAGLQVHSPAVVAGVLYRDGARDRDDATVLVARLDRGLARE